jgi:hypothetical protein
MEDRIGQSHPGGRGDSAFEGVVRTVLFLPEEVIETSHSQPERTLEGCFREHVLAWLSPFLGPEKDSVALLDLFQVCGTHWPMWDPIPHPEGRPLSSIIHSFPPTFSA